LRLSGIIEGVDNKKRHFWLRFLEWDLTTTIAGSVALALIIGFGFAASTPIVKFDFQGSAIDDIVSGGTPVMGSLDLYPEQGPGDIVYGWTNANILEYSDQDVSDKLKKDSNSGATSNTFKISGLAAKKYTFRFTVGSSDVDFSTGIVFSPQMTTSLVSEAGEWVTKDVVYEVGEDEDPLTLDFSSPDGTNWGIAGLAVYEADEPIIPPSFDLAVSPNHASVLAGNSTEFSVGVTPDKEYIYAIDFSVLNLPAGMTAEFVPSRMEDPPGSSTLTITTTASLAPTVYGVTIRAAGVDDPEAVVRTTTINITVAKAAEEREEDKDEDTEEIFGELPKATDSERVEESIEGFINVDKYIREVESEQLVIDKDLDEINKVALEFAAFPVVDLPPIPSTSTESALQTLTALGIIDTVVSSAPPGVRAYDEPQNLWQRFMGAIFSPAGG